MGNVTVFTAERSKQIEDSAIVSGQVIGDDLYLTRHDGTQFDAGNVRGPAGTNGINGTNGKDAAPGSVTPTPNTTPIRTSTSQLKAITPVATDDVPTKKYVDDADTAINNTVTANGTSITTLNKMVKGVELINGVNINSILTPGVYVQSQSVEASGGSNYPEGTAGLLEVFVNDQGAGNPNMVWQRYTLYGQFHRKVYQRAMYNGTWQPWVAMSEDTGWIDLTLASTHTLKLTPSYRKKDGIVYLKGAVGAPSGGYTTAFTLPAEARAPWDQYFPASSNTGVTMAIQILATGEVKTYMSASTTAWFPFNGVRFPVD